MTHVKYMKGLLGASALIVFSTSTAYAQNNFTPADTTVSNSFTLDYNVGGVPQPPIETFDDPSDPTDNDDPTTFQVDRLVNVTVASSGTASAFAPGETDAVVQFSVRNDGNDTHAYLLDFEQAGGTDDDFNTENSTSGDRIVYFVDTNGNGVLDGTEGDSANEITYDPSDDTTWPVLDADASVIVRVIQNIPVGVVDGDEALIHLYADTRDVTDPETNPIEADLDGVNTTDVAENVLIDLDGPASSTIDEATDGAHSATNTYFIEAADVTATKDVFVFDADYDGTCDPIGATYTPPAPSSDTGSDVPNNGFHVPDACVEYFITVRNDGTADATNIDLTDILPDHLVFRSTLVVGSLTGGSLSEPAAGVLCDGTTTTCNVTLTGATLAGKADAADPVVEGHLIIRATIQ